MTIQSTVFAPSRRLFVGGGAIGRRELEDDYRTHRMRLEHAMTVSDDTTSRHEVRTLLNFTEGKAGPYVDWLSALERKYKLKLGRES